MGFEVLDMCGGAEGMKHYPPEVNIKMTIPATSRITIEKTANRLMKIPLKTRLGADFIPKRERVHPTEEKTIAAKQDTSTMAK